MLIFCCHQQNTAMYFEILANMVRPQEFISLLSIFSACISLSRCGSFVTVTEDEAVQLEFPYSCDSNKVTIQSANRLPFYSSAEPESLYLPFYQFNRFTVADKNCLVQVDINPVKRKDEATYICQAYRDGVIQSELTRIRLNVNHPPGDVSCTFSINDDAVGDWVALQCMAPVGSLAGGIYCYQDSKRLPPQSQLVQTGKTLKQTIWVLKEEHPVFCCSSSLDQPKDMCECNDFVWEPSYTEKILNPFPVTTAGQGAIAEGPVDLLVTDTVNPSTSKTYPNDVKSSPLVRVTWIAPLILVTTLFIIKLYCFIKTSITTSSPEKKEDHPETNILMIKMQECESKTSERSPHSSKTHTKLGEEPNHGGTSVDIEEIVPIKGQLKAKSMGTLHLFPKKPS